MKRKIYGVFLFTAAVSLLTGCGNEDNPWNGSGSEGSLKLELASDGSVYRSTRADDTKATIVPSIEEFKIALSRTDGSSNLKWDNLTAFNKETSFPIGEYKLEAFFGDKDTEGFTAPYFYGSETVVVTAGDEKNVSITAVLANSMVSIRYTDEFNTLYPQHSAAIRSAGHDYIVFASTEDRPAYVSPSEISLNLTLTNAAGKQVTLQPAGFTANPRMHYIVTIGVSGASESGGVTLDVQFEENVVAETVTVPLGDELFEAPAPTVEAKDFTPGETLSAFESFVPDGDPRFEVYAFGGLKEVNFTLNRNSSYNPAFGNEVQLVNASDLDQSNVNSSGLEVLGLFRAPDKMGIVKLKNFLAKLPVGTHTVSLEVMDAMTRVSEPVSLTVVVTAVDIRIFSAQNIEFGDNKAVVYLSTNAPDVKDKATFKITADNLDATVENVEVLSAAPIPGLPSTLIYHYKYTLSTRAMKRDQTPVNVFYGTKADSRNTALMTMDFPKFSIETDAFAQRVKFRIVAEDPAKTDLIAQNILIIRDGKQVDTNRVRPIGNGIIEVKGLTGATTYNNVECALSFISNPHTPIFNFTTETETQVPNGDFSQVGRNILFSNIQVGGTWSGTIAIFGQSVTYTTKSTINRDEPSGWSTLNDFTCWSGSSNYNTWFLVPSTYLDGGATVIRTVGFNHAGTTPDKYNETGVGYNKNYPAFSQDNICAGELFLGSYSYDGTAHRTDGISFDSRPSFIKFDYQYTSYNNETGEAYVQVLDESGAIISDGYIELTATAGMVAKEVNLLDYSFGKKANKIIIAFKSTSRKSTPSINVPSGTALKETGGSAGNKTLDANSYHAFAMGSELKIDNVVLGYTPPSERMSVRARKTSSKK